MAVDATPSTTTAPPPRCSLCGYQALESIRSITVRSAPEDRLFCDAVCLEGWTRRAATDVASANAVYFVASKVVTEAFNRGDHRRDHEYAATLLRITAHALERLHFEHDRAREAVEQREEAA